jgi:hypothetical protein
MDRNFYLFFALTLCLLVLFFTPTVVAFVKFVHCYNRKGFFDAAELCNNEETKLCDREIEGMIQNIVEEEKMKAIRDEVPLRFYDYIHALDQDPVVEEFTKKHTKYRQYNYWLHVMESLL